jgi:hypothetical protein
MGFFDKIKAAKNAITGGAANVSLEIGEGQRGQPVSLRITANAKANLDAKRVYVIVRALEEAVIENYQTGNGKETIREEEVAHEIKLDVAGATKMVEGENQIWEANVQLPMGAASTYRGKMIRHTWKAQAGLDTVGNDPDSGWVEFNVN